MDDITFVSDEAGFVTSTEVQAQARNMDGKTGLGATLQMHCALDVEWQTQKKNIEISHRVGRARENEQQAMGRIRESRLAPLLAIGRPYISAKPRDESQVLDHDPVLIECSGWY